MRAMRVGLALLLLGGFMFASDTTQTVPVAFDPPHTITIQKLTGKQLELAQEAAMESKVRSVRLLGQVAGLQRDVQKLLKAGKGTSAKQALEEAKSDPLIWFDKLTLATYGAKAWTYGKPVNAETIADLDEQGLDFTARAVLQLTKPELFQTLEEQEQARKNG
jgi:hypothetical protein